MVLHAKGTIKSNKRSWTHHQRIRYETSSLGVNIPLMSPRSKDVSKVEMGTSWLLLRQSTIEKQWIGISGRRSWRIGMKLRQWDRDVYNASATNLHRAAAIGFQDLILHLPKRWWDLFCFVMRVKFRRGFIALPWEKNDQIKNPPWMSIGCNKKGQS